MGRIWAVDEVILKCALMNGIAFEGSDEPIVLLTTTSIPIRTIAAFLFCTQRLSILSRGF